MTLEPESTPRGLGQLECPGDHPRSPSRVPIDRRRETRYPTNDAVQIRCLDAGVGPWVGAKVLDVSRSGLRIELGTPIYQGMRVEIVVQDQAIIFAETRYCRQVASVYHIGAEIEVVYFAHFEFAGHIENDQLSLYRAGKGLTVLQTLRVVNHLLTCTTCRDVLSKTEAAQHSDLGESQESVL